MVSINHSFATIHIELAHIHIPLRIPHNGVKQGIYRKEILHNIKCSLQQQLVLLSHGDLH